MKLGVRLWFGGEVFSWRDEARRINCCSEFFLPGTLAAAVFALLLSLRAFTEAHFLGHKRTKGFIICPQRHFHNKFDCHVSCFNYSLPFRSGRSLAVLLDFTLSNNNSSHFLSHTYLYLRWQQGWSSELGLSVTPTRWSTVRHLSNYRSQFDYNFYKKSGSPEDVLQF